MLLNVSCCRFRGFTRRSGTVCCAQPSGNPPSFSDENKAFRINDNNRRRVAPSPGSGPTNDLIKSLSELNKGQRLKGNTTVFGSEASTWRTVDQAVNKYPGLRTFTAIGATSEEFTAAMVAIVQDELCCKVHEESIIVRPSKEGKYSSVKIGPVTVVNPDQVLAIYGKMKEDPRLKWLF